MAHVISNCCKAQPMSDPAPEARYYYRCTKCGKPTAVTKVEEQEGKKV